MRLLRTKLATTIGLLACASATLGFTVTVPTVMFNGIPLRLLNSPPPDYPPSVAAGVFDMYPSTQFEVNGDALPAPAAGFSTLRKRDNTGGGVQANSTPDGGAFRIVCSTSHLAFTDPIVYPPNGSVTYPFRSHLHNFFGNTSVSHLTQPTTLLATVGNSSCVGGTANRSGYWVPAVIDTSTGFPVIPYANIVYYKNESTYRRANLTAVTVPPPDLRIIAGNPANTSTTLGNAYRWECPLGANFSATIPGAGCANGSDVQLLVFFPQCWDGVNKDTNTVQAQSAPYNYPNDHQSHMAYENPTTGCPSSHPVMIPQISFNIRYKVTAASRPENWRLHSDTYATSFAAGGLSAHGDWWNGWNAGVLTQIVQGCLHASLDCHAHLLGLSPNETLY
jgi:hypothetical protein